MGSTLSFCRCLEIDRLADYTTEFRPGRRKEDRQPDEQDVQPEDANSSGSSKVIYKGEYKNRKRHGFGILIQPCGSRFEGYFIDDAANGPGKFIHPSGDMYEGQWRNNKAHGTGTFTHSDGSCYQGQWVNDIQEGVGREQWMDGSSYEGTYKSGLKNGNGVFTWPGGSSYKGQFFDNDIHGEGTYVWIDGKSYSGQWARNHMNGQGRMTFPDGRVHEGGYANDRKHGKGRLIWPDGRSFEGEWDEGRQVPGVGVYRDSEGREIPNPLVFPSGPTSPPNPDGSPTQGSPDVLSDSNKGCSNVKGESEEARKKSLFTMSHNHQRRRGGETPGTSTGGSEGTLRRRSDSRVCCPSPRQGERGAEGVEGDARTLGQGHDWSTVGVQGGDADRKGAPEMEEGREVPATGKKRRGFSRMFGFGRKKMESA